MPDKYDEAIAELMNLEEYLFHGAVRAAWEQPRPDGPGCLFQMAGNSTLVDGKVCGCLTQIRDEPDHYTAATRDLTASIVKDDRIPRCPEDITPEDLPVFAEWQRKIDAMGVR